MPTLVQINTVVNYTSTGRIAEGIGKVALAAGWRSVIAFGRHPRCSASETISIVDRIGTFSHGVATRLLDRHGLHSQRATHRLVRALAQLRPDVVHLHNLHGYYLNYPILFRYLRSAGRPVVWTLHDCWPFTGHCCYFDLASCSRWSEGCRRCPLLRTYPSSFVFDRSARSWKEKRDAFSNIPQLQIITPSQWLANQVENSFLGGYPRHTIAYGVDLDTFRPVPESELLRKYPFHRKFLVLAVASEWDARKGLGHVVALRSLLPRDAYDIAIVGVTPRQAAQLPDGVVPIQRTDSPHDLAALYSRATVFVNPTLADNFPVTNLESLACGTPVVTYDSGGSSEAIDAGTGAAVARGNVTALATAIVGIAGDNRAALRTRCRDRATATCELETQYDRYVHLYRSLLSDAV